MVNLLFSLLHKFQLNNAIKSGLQVGKDFRCQGSVTFGSEPYLIKIGDHVSLSFKVRFITHDGGTWVFRDSAPEYKDISKFGPIVIHDNCFIGACSIILPNITIGKNSIIGAGSVVTKNVPANSVWAGVPARHICSTESYKQKCLTENQRITGKNKKNELLVLFRDILHHGTSR